MNARLISLFVALVAVALIVPGCGSDSDGDSNGTQAGAGTAAAQEEETQSGQAAEAESESESEGAGDGSASPEKAAFVKEASAACTKAREGGFEEVKGSQNATSSLEGVLLLTIEAEIEAIGSLTPPAEDAKEIEEVVADMQVTLEKARAMKGASYVEIEDLFGGTDTKLEAYGLSACSKSA